jgi:hypothetical protein
MHVYMQVEGCPGPVTLCVEAEGDIARRRHIFFKIRGNQPLKRLLRAYLSSAFLVYPDTPLVFYFKNQVFTRTCQHEFAPVAKCSKERAKSSERQALMASEHVTCVA